MPERYAVICTCGYTTLVSGSDFGTSVECFNCGAELEVDESSATPESANEDAAALEADYDHGLPESPLVVHSTFEAGPTEGRPPSPFEEETEHSEVLPERPEEPSPEPRARSPFEEEETEEEEPATRGPFTLEPAPESADASFAKLIEAERPKVGSRHVIIETESSLDQKTGEKCANCGRELRGDWDRFETPDEVICYRCSNQATHGMPQRILTEKGQRELTGDDYLIAEKEKPVEQPQAPWYTNPKSEVFRRTLWALAIGTLLFGVYIYLSDESQPPPGQMQTVGEVVEDIAQMPLWARGVLQAWGILSVFLSGLIASYLVLKQFEWLPHDAFLRDMLYIGTIVFALTIMHFVLTAMGGFVGQIPMFGAIMSILLPLARVLIAALALNMFLDMRIKHLLLTFLVYFLLRRILFAAIGVFIYRALSTLT